VPPFVALTGGLGAGKSTALQILERLGAATISTDAVVHELYGSALVRDAVLARFGSHVAPGGVIDRAALAQRVFCADAGAAGDDREWLEQLLWPLVRQRVAEWRAATLAGRGAPPVALVVEVPLLFESGSEGMYDASIAVVADERLRGSRARDRDHRAIAQRERRQLSQQDKASRATYVVVNDGDLTELEAKLSAILVMLKGRWSQP
jgi:dephospho-CoA kinase